MRTPHFKAGATLHCALVGAALAGLTFGSVGADARTRHRHQRFPFFTGNFWPHPRHHRRHFRDHAAHAHPEIGSTEDLPPRQRHDRWRTADLPPPISVPLPPARPLEIMTPSATLPMAHSSIPLPPPRPPEFVAPQAPSPIPTATPGVAPAIIPSAADNDALRQKLLASGHVEAEALAPISGNGGCGIAAPVRLEAVLLPNGAKVTLAPAVTLRASLAATFADWLRDDLEPALAEKGDRLTEIVGTGGYACRSRDSIAGAKLSEHAMGNALDLHAFVTKAGKTYAIVGSGEPQPAAIQAFLNLAKTSACQRFMTVLGPGADLYHTQHLHIDLEARRHGTHLCQWNVPPLAAKVEPRDPDPPAKR